MFLVYYLLRHRPDLSVVLLDKGKTVNDRSFANARTRHANRESHDLVSGAGGAGLDSDGRLILTLRPGGKLENLLSGRREDILAHFG